MESGEGHSTGCKSISHSHSHCLWTPFSHCDDGGDGDDKDDDGYGKDGDGGDDDKEDDGDGGQMGQICSSPICTNNMQTLNTGGGDPLLTITRNYASFD